MAALKGALKQLRRIKWWLFDARLALEEPANRAFDARFGVDTAGEVRLTDAGIAAADAARGNLLYRAVWTSLCCRALEALQIDHSRFTFVDYGSGKGKAMLLASNYPYAKIVGLEYAPTLH